MTIPTRRLRALAQDRKPSAFPLTERQRAREENIVELATAILAEFGTHTITFSSLAIALRLSRATLRFHFCDLHALLADILHRHLMAISRALAAIPLDDPNLHPRRRAAYLEATRTPTGALNEAHLLLVRDRHLLPPDLLPAIELTRQGLGPMLAPRLADEALALLDTPALDAPRIEARLTHVAPPPPRRPHLDAAPPPRATWMGEPSAPHHHEAPPITAPPRPRSPHLDAGPAPHPASPWPSTAPALDTNSYHN
jgi:AcrR family transcriptional regulator